MLRLNPITRLLSGRTLLLVIGILALVEAVFIAESFTTLLGLVVGNGGDFFKLALFLALKMPETIDFGLPIALVISLYFALSTARDESELIICAAAGVSWKRIPVFMFTVGILGMLVSLTVSGLIAPVANYTLRIAVFELEATKIKRQVLNPSSNDFMHEIDGKTLISIDRQERPNAKRGKLFFYQPTELGNWHVSLADDWSAQENKQDNAFEATMEGFRDYFGNLGGFTKVDQSGAETQLQVTPDIAIKDPPKFSSTAIKKVTLRFELEDLLKSIDRSRQNNELPIADLTQGFGGGSDGELRKAFAVKIARALLCPAAALFALLAVASSHLTGGRMLTLPLAAVAVIGLDVIGRTLFADAAIVGLSALIITIIASVLVVFVPTLVLIFHFGERVIRPNQEYAR